MASSHFKKNALLITNAAKGELAETVSNISITVEMATKLKERNHLLTLNLRLECGNAIKQYIAVVVNVYDRVINNYVKYCNNIASANPFTKYFYVNAININGSTERSQFMNISDILKIQKNIPIYLDLQKQIKALNLVNIEDVKSDLIKMHLLGGGLSLLGISIILFTKDVNFMQYGSAIFLI